MLCIFADCLSVPEAYRIMQRSVSILGSTGSIGTQTLDVIGVNPKDFVINFLTTNSRIDLLEEQVERFNPKGVAIANEEAFHAFKAKTAFKGKIVCGDEGVLEAASAGDDLVVSALVGFSGVFPTLAAINAGSVIALANKETLVSAGYAIMKAAREKSVPIIAIDSEHSALLQCMAGENIEDIEKLILTASGGPFRTLPREEFSTITPERALKHPNWTMGAKITIDSATLMNKGFEVIEAKWLFSVSSQQIEVLVHPQSIIHSMVQFTDGSIKAQLGTPDMRIPIAHALYYPRHGKYDFPRLDFLQHSTLTFELPNTEKFPCLRFAYECMERGGTSTAVLNAANEIAVYSFLDKQCSFLDIPKFIDKALSESSIVDNPDLNDIHNADIRTRELVRSYLRK